MPVAKKRDTAGAAIQRTGTTLDVQVDGATIQVNGSNQLEVIGGGAPAAADVTYDNTTSGLTADDVQEAIDELAATGGGPVAAADVSYDNTTSGAAATDVQAAIDELFAGGATLPTPRQAGDFLYSGDGATFEAQHPVVTGTGLPVVTAAGRFVVS